MIMVIRAICVNRFLVQHENIPFATELCLMVVFAVDTKVIAPLYLLEPLRASNCLCLEIVLNLWYIDYLQRLWVQAGHLLDVASTQPPFFRANNSE